VKSEQKMEKGDQTWGALPGKKGHQLKKRRKIARSETAPRKGRGKLEGRSGFPRKRWESNRLGWRKTTEIRGTKELGGCEGLGERIG